MTRLPRRMVHAKIWDCDQFMSLSIPERLLYLALITCADDEGCFRADPKHWKRMVFYADRLGDQKVGVMLKHIEEVGLIVIGQAEKGIAGFHPNWHSYQTLQRQKSKPSPFSDLLVAHGRQPHVEAAFEVNESQEEEKEIKDRVAEGYSGRQKMQEAWDARRNGLADRMNMNK